MEEYKRSVKSAYKIQNLTKEIKISIYILSLYSNKYLKMIVIENDVKQIFGCDWLETKPCSTIGRNIFFSL